MVDHVDASSITIPQGQLAGSALVLLYALLALLVLNLLAHIATSVMLLRTCGANAPCAAWWAGLKKSVTMTRVR